MFVSPMKKSTLSSTEPCSAVMVQELLQDDWLSRLLMLPLDWLLLLLMPEEWILCSVFTGGWKTSTEYLENVIIDYWGISVTTCKPHFPGENNLFSISKKSKEGNNVTLTIISTLSITINWHKPQRSIHTFVNGVYSFKCYL